LTPVSRWCAITAEGRCSTCRTPIREARDAPFALPEGRGTGSRLLPQPHAQRSVPGRRRSGAYGRAFPRSAAVALLVRPSPQTQHGGIFIRETARHGRSELPRVPFQAALLPVSLVVPRSSSATPRPVAPDRPRRRRQARPRSSCAHDFAPEGSVAGPAGAAAGGSGSAAASSGASGAGGATRAGRASAVVERAEEPAVESSSTKARSRATARTRAWVWGPWLRLWWPVRACCSFIPACFAMAAAAR